MSWKKVNVVFSNGYKNDCTIEKDNYKDLNLIVFMKISDMKLYNVFNCIHFGAKHARIKISTKWHMVAI